MPELKKKYEEEVVPALMERFSYKNKLQAPSLHKVILNIGVGEATQNIKLLENAARDLTIISGQKPVTRRAKLSVANFKLRKGNAIGVSVTLRGKRMFDFLDRFMNIAAPRIRDFRGFNPNSFDGRGNYSVGIREQIIFPEIDYDTIDAIRGMNITIVTTAKTDEEAFELLKGIGFPFRRK
ncbi:MAG: 50S ribosomal protein L5 [candidate division Zixibacteria bacterium 4484_93]|nr:MAG: 50S ribosomal protein L5 [candidate division Zixibacteria bacterium 4484_93]